MQKKMEKTKSKSAKSKKHKSKIKGKNKGKKRKDKRGKNRKKMDLSICFCFFFRFEFCLFFCFYFVFSRQKAKKNFKKNENNNNNKSKTKAKKQIEKTKNKQQKCKWTSPFFPFFHPFWRSFVFPFIVLPVFFHVWSVLKFFFWFSMCFPFFLGGVQEIFSSLKNIRTSLFYFFSKLEKKKLKKQKGEENIRFGSCKNRSMTILKRTKITTILKNNYDI